MVTYCAEFLYKVGGNETGTVKETKVAPSDGRVVPFLDLQVQYETIREKVLEAITKVCDGQRFILGSEVEAFEREIANFLGVNQAIGVSSGTDALLLALKAVGIGPGTEVVTSTYSFFASAGTIVRLGAKPVFVDIDSFGFNLDPAAVVSAITPRTRAILPVHLFGLSADLEKISTAAKSAGIPVIEDACQTIGGTYNSHPVGSIGKAGCFSFFPSKNLGGFGDGGLVTCDDEAFANRLRALRVHETVSVEGNNVVGGNFRLDELQAAVLRVKMPHVNDWTEGRRRNAERYAMLFKASRLDEHVVLPVQPDGTRHVYNQYVIRAARRDELRKHLNASGIGTAVYYPEPFHLQRVFADLGYQIGDFPNAELASREALAIPIYPELTEEQQAYVVRSIAEFYGSSCL